MPKITPGRALLSIVLLHIAIVLRFEPLSVIFGPDPIAVIDYETHAEQTLRAVEAFRSWKHIWAYDPHLLAGQVSGAIFDADNRLHELFTLALTYCGATPARGFNLFILLVHLGVLPVVYVSARLFRLSPWAATAATGLASMVWLFDSFSHWAFWVGMISWGAASYATLLPVALFFDWIHSRKPRQIALVTLSLVVVHHLHPYSFFVLVVPIGFLYWRAFRTLVSRDHIAVVLMGAITIFANLWWLAAAARFWHYVLGSGFYLDATPDYLLTDYLGLLQEPSTSGVMAVRSSYRFLALGAALLCLLSWRKSDDDRYPVFSVTLGVLLVSAYAGGYLPALRHIQPYRFVLPVAFFACIPAAVFFEDTLRSWRETPPSRALSLAFGLAAFVALPRLLRDAIYFLPFLVPHFKQPLPGSPPNINGPIGFGAIVWPEPYDFRHVRMPDDTRELERFVAKNDDGSGRWLVEWWMLGERLAWSTNAPVLGGFRELNMQHSDANFFRHNPDGDTKDPRDFNRYLERYAVEWVIMTTPMPAIESRTDVLELVKVVQGSRIYRTKTPLSFFEGGLSGHVKASLNRLEVTGTQGGAMTLRYHYLDTLLCKPNCKVSRAPVPTDRVGFLHVENAPPNFEIVNGY